MQGLPAVSYPEFHDNCISLLYLFWYSWADSFLSLDFLCCFAAAAKSLQSCLTLCDPIDGSPTGFHNPGILQARIVEWVAISFSKAWKWKVKVKSLSHVRLLATPWTAAYQAPPSKGFSRQEYWTGVPLPSVVLEITNYYNYLVAKFAKLCHYEISYKTLLSKYIHTHTHSLSGSVYGFRWQSCYRTLNYCSLNYFVLRRKQK